MAKKIKLILAAFVAVFALVGISFAFTDNTQAEEKAAVHIQISPVKQKISVKPGDSYTDTVKVQNVGAARFNYNVYATPYSVTSDKYDPNYSNFTTFSQMSKWITFDENTAKGALDPGETRDVRYTVNVPEDVPAGGQYAAIMAETADGNDENSTVNVVHRVGTILYAAIPGETRVSGEIVKNNVNTFYFSPPLTVTSLVKNTGNVEETAKYTVKIYPLFSNEAVFNTEEAEENAYSRDIMPETERFNSITWEGAPSIGIFKVTQIIDFAGQDQNHEVTKLVLICPLWLLFVIFALLFFIIFWLVSRARDRKRADKSANSNKSSSNAEAKSKEAKKSSDKEDK